MTFRVSALPALLALFLLAGSAVAAPKAEDRAWKRIESALQSDEAPDRLLLRLQDYLQSHPDGAHAVDAHLEAGRAHFELENWQDARASMQRYLTGGGRRSIEEASFVTAICLARERRVDDATAALHNVVTKAEDAERARSAARELAALHAFEGSEFRALDALALLADRGLFEERPDLDLARKYAADLSDDAMDTAEGTRRGSPMGALLAVLLLDRREELLASDATAEARRRFADRYAESSLLALVPGAEDFAGEPEDVEAMKVGLLLPESGKFAAPGALARRGVDLALESARTMGWAEVEVVPIDTQGDPEASKKALEALKDTHKVVGVVGPLISVEAETAAVVAEDLGMPMVMMTQRPGLAADRANVFNTWSPPEEQAEKLVEHAMGRMGMDKFAIAYPETEVAARAAARFWERVEEAGGQVVSVESFHAGEKDFRKTGARLKGAHYKANPPGEADRVLPFLPEHRKPQLADTSVALVPGVDFQAVFVPTNYKQATMVAPGFLYEEINIGGHLDEKDYPAVVFMGGSAFNHPGLIERGGKYMEGTVLVDGFFLGTDGPASEFAATYKERYGASPSILEAVAYDATLLMLQLVAEGVSGRRELRRRLALSTPVRAVTGSRGFGDDGEMRHELRTLSVRKGAIVQVWPPPGGQTKEPTPTFKDGEQAPGRSE